MLYAMEGADGFKALLITPRKCDSCGTPYTMTQLFAPSLIHEEGTTPIAYSDYMTIFDRDKENG